ncbi:Diphosphomevalonate decarboxylase [Yarrowia sp. E02]|nr:Diphosphomevalonate decarboxylase [Yarrowia sp. E02]
MIHQASTTAPVNIATLKYWGKRDPALNLPTNNSISVTLSQDDLRTLTTASCSPEYVQDELWLNGKQEDVSGKRLVACFRELRALRLKMEEQDASLPKLADQKLKIVSENNFPTAAGLASSAAGFAALIRAVANLYELKETPEQLSIVARQGSGSACRSLYGGYVAWEMGSEADGSDSRAVQIATADHWPEMRAAILVVSADKKDTSSTTGMQVTVHTSPLFKERITTVVPERFVQMKKSILDRDFPTFAELTMRDSNQFHATCLDSYPPIFYLNDVSRASIRVVESINKAAGATIAAYTFDAGPNCVIYYEDKNEELVLGALKAILGNVEGWEKHQSIDAKEIEVDERWESELANGIQRVILTKVGGDPVKTSETLINEDGSLKNSI